MNTEPTTPEEQESLEKHIEFLSKLCEHSADMTRAIEYSCGITDAPTPTKYSQLCRVEPDYRLEESQKLKFHEIIKSTNRAICLAFVDKETGHVVDEWFPKGVCANLDLTEGTVYVWDKFLRDNKDYMLKEAWYHAD